MKCDSLQSCLVYASILFLRTLCDCNRRKEHVELPFVEETYDYATNDVSDTDPRII